MEHQLKSDNFSLNIKLQIFKEDIRLPTNTIMEIEVLSDGFSANAAMDIDIKEFARFALDLSHVYETMSGEARIEEPYGMHMYLLFIGNGKGHIAIKGYLHKGNRIGNEHILKFENDIDQTSLSSFCYDLLSNYKKYLQ